MSSKIYTAPVPRMPPGLIELMEGLVRDVLKNNPPNVYEFCAQHMEKLLKIRDGATGKGLTLSQKVIKAQERVRQRAQLRHAQYQKELQLLEVKENQINNIEIGNESIPICCVELSPTIDTKTSNEFKHLKQTQENDQKEKEKGVDLEGGNQIEYPQTEQRSSEITKLNDAQAVLENTILDTSEMKSLPESTAVSIDERNNTTADTMGTQCSTDLVEETNNTSNVEDMTADKNETVSQVSPNLSFVEINLNSTANKENSDTSIFLRKVSNENISDILPAKITDEHGNLNDNLNNKEDPNLESFDDVKDDLQNSHINDDVAATREDNSLETFLPTVNYDPASEEKDTDFVRPNQMDLEKAAITIQKIFRTFLFRSKTSSVEEATNVDINQLIDDSDKQEHERMENVNSNKDKRALGLSRLDSVLQTVNEEKSLSLSTDDSSTLSSAATIIQAHVRGFLIRNKLNLNKTLSTTSNIDSDIQSPTSLERDNNNKNKTILNIHIIPEGGNYLSRDESMITSIDLPLDGSPPCSSNLHPLGYDKNEPRKQLKREDAVQSISPPSNNSGKSDEVDSVKEALAQLVNTNNSVVETSKINSIVTNNSVSMDKGDGISNIREETVNNLTNTNHSEIIVSHEQKIQNSCEITTDEMDVITPYLASEDKESVELSKSKLMHSGEFHDIVLPSLPTMVSRSNTSVVREFQNVLVYFLLWNNP